MNLNWTATTEIRLREALIEDPDHPGQMTNTITGGRIATDGTFVHIDPRTEPDNSPHTITAVQTASILAFTYQEEPATGTLPPRGSMGRVIG